MTTPTFFGEEICIFCFLQGTHPITLFTYLKYKDYTLFALSTFQVTWNKLLDKCYETPGKNTMLKSKAYCTACFLCSSLCVRHVLVLLLLFFTSVPPPPSKL